MATRIPKLVLIAIPPKNPTVPTLGGTLSYQTPAKRKTAVSDHEAREGREATNFQTKSSRSSWLSHQKPVFQPELQDPRGGSAAIVVMRPNVPEVQVRRRNVAVETIRRR